MICLSQHNTSTLIITLFESQIGFLKLHDKNHSIASSFFSFIYFVPYKQLANNQRQAVRLLTDKENLSF